MKKKNSFVCENKLCIADTPQANKCLFMAQKKQQ